MINSIEDLRSAGVLPTGPVSAWPQERNVGGQVKQHGETPEKYQRKKPEKVKATPKQMLKGVARNAAQAFINGRVKPSIRNERFNTCQECPSFIKDSGRCSECGCFMSAKSWIGGDPKKLCPLQKWAN